MATDEIPRGFQRCPYCAELIRLEAKLCRFCGSMLVAEMPPLRLPDKMGLNDQVVQQLIHTSSAVPILTFGDRRVATVFFFDIEGYTRMSQQMDAEDIQSLLNEYYAGAIEIIEQHDGTVDNIVGDEILAVFGVPVAHEYDADLALRSAAAILEYTRSFNQRHLYEIHIHGGIHTGLVVTGDIGSVSRSKFSLVGTTVNLASRLTSQARRDEILVSFETYEQVAGQFTFEPVGPLQLKDFEQPIRAFRLLGLNPEYTAIAPPPRAVRSPYIGREEELGRIREMLWKRSEDRPLAMRIVGEMGIGKTRLVTEAIRRFAPDALSVRGAAVHWARQVPLFTVSDLMRSLFAVGPLSGNEPIRQRVKERLGELGMSNGEEEIWLRHLFGDSQASASLSLQSHGDRLKKLTETVISLLRTFSSRRKLILIFDDLQWADPATLLLIREMLQGNGFEGCWVFLIERAPGENTEWAGLEEVELSVLPEQESRVLLESVFEQIGVSQRLQNIILRRGEGNPLFLEELAKMVQDELLSRPDSDSATLEKRIEMEVPQSVQNIIQARVDRLEIKTRLVLQCGAVLGREFLFDALAVIEMVKEGLMDRLVTLESLQLLLRRVDETFLKYYFRNSLTQEVVYGSMLRRQRQQMHEMVANALERLFQSRGNVYSAQLAYHWTEAGDKARSSHFLIQAAKRAMDLGDLHLAHVQVESAISQLTELDATDENQRMMLEGLLLDGKVQRLSGDLIESQHLLHTALHSARHLQDRAMICTALVELADTLVRRGRHDWGRRLLNIALRYGGRSDEARECLCLTHRLLAIIEWQQGRLDEALNHCNEVTRLTDENSALSSDAHNNAGLICWSRGDLKTAQRELTLASDLWRRHQLIYGEVATECNLGIISEQMGEFNRARRHYQLALERARAIRHRQVETAVLANMANLMLLAQRWTQALENSLRSEEMALEMGDRRSAAIALENRALSEIGLGDFDAAAQSIERGRALARDLIDEERLLSLTLTEVEMLLARGDVPGASEALQRAGDAEGVERWAYLESALELARAKVALRISENEEALRNLERSLEIAKRDSNIASELQALRTFVGNAERFRVSEARWAESQERLRLIEQELML